MPIQSPQFTSRKVGDRDAWCEIAAQPGGVAAIVELSVFMGVELLVEESNFVEHIATIGDGDTLGWYELRLIRVDK